MKNRRYLVVGLLLVAAVGWAGWQAVRRGAPEPVYQGKPLSYWLTNYASPPRSLMSDSNAVPFLIRALRRDSWIGAAVYRKQVWPNLPAPMQKHLPPPIDHKEIRFAAALLLHGMGPVAKPAIPALIQTVRRDDNPNVRSLALAALGHVGNDDGNVLAILTRALNDRDGHIRQMATNTLLTIDPEAAAKAGVKPPSR